MFDRTNLVKIFVSKNLFLCADIFVSNLRICPKQQLKCRNNRCNKKTLSVRPIKPPYILLIHGQRNSAIESVTCEDNVKLEADTVADSVGDNVTTSGSDIVY